MKKLIPMIIACLLLTGCRQTNIEKVAQGLEDAKNYDAKVLLQINGTFNNKKMDYERVKNITIDNINSSAKIDTTVIENDKETDEIYYIKSNKDELTTYKKYNDMYISKIEPKDKNSIYYITAFINKNSTYQYIDKEDGIAHFVVTLNKDRVKNFLNSYYDVDFLNDLDYEIKDSAKINVYANNKTSKIISLDVDLTSIVKITNIKSYNLDKFYLEINYDNFGSASSITIPDEYILNAIEENKVYAYEEATKYIKKINDLSLNEKVTTYTNNDLKYDGYKPSKVNLTIIKGKVISGNITINDYNFKVESGNVVEPTNKLVE